MAQAGYTPIQIYYSTTTTNTPSAGNLTDGELAINTADGKLFYKDNLGAVQVIATKAGANGDAVLANNNAFTGANTFFNATGQTFGTATSTQDGFTITGRAGGSSSYRMTLTPGALTSARTATFPDKTFTVGFRNIPLSGSAKTSSYILAVTDVGEYIQVGSGGSIVIPDATFSGGDVVSIFNNTAGGITITCTITTAYIAGTDSDKASVTLATRGVATILFISSTVCVITGNVT